MHMYIADDVTLPWVAMNFFGLEKPYTQRQTVLMRRAVWCVHVLSHVNVAGVDVVTVFTAAKMAACWRRLQ